MLRTDFAKQFSKPLAIGLTIALLSAFLILILPSNKAIKTYHNPSSPSTYRVFLKEYLSIIENKFPELIAQK